MVRKTLITVHMYLAAFFAPAVLLVAISGGLYLVGVKGNVELDSIYSSDLVLDGKSSSLKADVDKLLNAAGASDYRFEYISVKNDTLYTRPTSAEHYVIKLGSAGLEVLHARPNLQSRMIELHKGHGPKAFKTFQKLFAIGLVCIIASGLWLGLSAAKLRRSTLLTAGAGAVVFALLLL
ncbi:MAG: PepSY-associated TM helix domain-containing protein [Halioglobus sp.]